MPNTDWKCDITVQMSNPAAQFNETFYTQAGTVQTALAQLTKFVKARANLLAGSAFIRRWKVSDVDVRRDSLSTRGEVRGALGEKELPLANDYASLGWNVRLGGSATVWRSWIIRGLPDQYLGGSAAEEFRATVTKAVDKVVAAAVVNKLTIRTRSLTVPAPINVVGVAVDGDGFTVTTQAAHSLVVGGRVTVRGVRKPHINGIWSISAVPTVTTFVVSKIGITPLVWSAGGTIQGFSAGSFTYTPIDADFCTVESVTTRKTGIPFDRRRGRSRPQSR